MRKLVYKFNFIPQKVKKLRETMGALCYILGMIIWKEQEQ